MHPTTLFTVSWRARAEDVAGIRCSQWLAGLLILCYKLVRPLQNRASKQQIVDSFGDSQWSGGFAGAGEYIYLKCSPCLSTHYIHMYTDNCYNLFCAE